MDDPDKLEIRIMRKDEFPVKESDYKKVFDDVKYGNNMFTSKMFRLFKGEPTRHLDRHYYSFIGYHAAGKHGNSYFVWNSSGKLFTEILTDLKDKLDTEFQIQLFINDKMMAHIDLVKPYEYTPPGTGGKKRNSRKSSRKKRKSIRKKRKSRRRR
jgi:hypothetical protein